MSKITIFFLCLTNIVSSQTSKLKYEDIKHYYVFSGTLMDVRTHTPVIPNKVFGGLSPLFHKKNNYLTYWDHGLVTINSEGKFINSITLGFQSSASPDYKTILYNKEGDLWSANVNFSNGKLNGQKQLTQLGILANPAVCNWYGDHILLANNFQSGKNEMVLQLDSKSGNIEESFQFKHGEGKPVERSYFLSDKPASNVISPNRRYYLIVEKSTTPLVFDMKDFTNKPLNLPPLNNYFCSWISDTLAIVWAGDMYTSKIYKTNWENRTVEELLEGKSNIDVNRFRAESKLESRNRSHNISLDGGHILIPLKEEIKNANYMVMNLQDSGLKLINPQVIISNISKNYYWISGEAFIYRREGDLKTQGTWLYNIQTMQHVRLTPYLFQEVIVLPEANKVVFTANYNLFETDLKGSNPKQIGNKQYSTYNFYLQNFDPIIDTESFTHPATGSNSPNLVQQPIGSATTVKGKVQTKQGSNLRLRSEPSDTSTILTQIPNGSEVKIIAEDNKDVIVSGEKGKWLKIEYNGTVGWAWGGFIKKQ